MPEATAKGGFETRARTDGNFELDYVCWGDAAVSTGNAWIALLFELAADPTVPEHNPLFVIPQFVYDRLQHNAPLVAAGVWATGRGPASDLDVNGRFAPYWCEDHP